MDNFYEHHNYPSYLIFNSFVQNPGEHDIRDDRLVITLTYFYKMGFLYQALCSAFSYNMMNLSNS